MINLSSIVTNLASVSAASSTMRGVIQPLVDTLSVMAGLVCAGFLVSAGLQYMTSSGRPDRLAHAKTVMRDALIGLVLVLGAATLTSILSHAYGSPSTGLNANLPNLGSIQPAHQSLSLVDLIIKAITGVLQDIVQTIGQPFISALEFFTTKT